MDDDHEEAHKMEGEKKKRAVEESMVVCCRVFISETRNTAALEAIERAAARQAEEAVIVNKFDDKHYNRVRYTIVSYVDFFAGGAVYSPLTRAVVAMAEAAYAVVDLREHTGAHPRLGVLDDVVFHPLAGASLHHAALLADATARQIAARFQVPVYLYGAAHPRGKAADAIRRELGYYRPNLRGNQWAGWTVADALPEPPDVGPSAVAQARGVTMIGACAWFAFFNVPILTSDESAAKRIARAVSARGGGLPSVQTLCLAHGSGAAEVACILLDPTRVGADRVQTRLEALAPREGLAVGEGYFTDHSAEMVVHNYMHLISST